ncbi:hypothetical protein Arub01_46960 [Actinomadura rubrobrunea]|uniref:Uncharacterized protein n=1 Tax=Actinomadura rubrobrunea TaxID=115335 RepID=A0A9W6UYP0_9ACTN|nr:hypothetical protein Arub01_46960 [Actinomadura rubrobrunea]
MPHYHPPTPFAIARSLTDRAPETVVTDWTRGAALLPAGRRWDAVQAPAPLGRALLSHGHTLGKGVESGAWPVFCGPSDDDQVLFFFLVPPGTAKAWKVKGIVCLCQEDVAVPAPTLEGPCTDLHPAADVARSTVTVRHWIQTPHLTPKGKVVLAEPHLLAQGLETALEHAGAVR